MKMENNSRKYIEKQNLSGIGIFFLLLAIVVTLTFFYFSYVTFIEKKNILFDSNKRSPIESLVSENINSIQTIITGSHIDNLDRDVKSNKKLQELESYREPKVLRKSGNRNPFKPIDLLTVERPKSTATELLDIKPPILPR